MVWFGAPDTAKDAQLSLVRLVGVGAAYCAVAYLCLSLTRFGASVESIWAPNALLSAALIVATRARWPALLLSAAAGHVLAHVLVGDALPITFAFLVSDFAEIALCATLLRARPDALTFQGRIGVSYFIVICVGSAVASTAVAALTTSIAGAPLGAFDLLVWFAGDTLGLLVFLPLFYGFAARQWRRVRAKPWLFAAALVLIVALASIDALTYGPLARLILMPLMVIIAFEFGVVGVEISIGTLLLAWTAFMLAGILPGDWPEFGTRTTLLLAQAFIAAIALTSMPLAVMLEERERNSLKLAQAAKEEAAKIEAEKANAFKSRLIAMASHDLRQPLQAAHAYLDVLEARLTDAHLRGVCVNAGQALDTMNNILDSLLDVTRLDAGIIAPRPRSFAIGEMLQRLIASNAPHAEAKGLELALQALPVSVYSDANLVERVLANFLSNAIRYTPAGKVTLWCEERNGHAVIHVTDTGIGIPPEALCAVFDDYVQLNNPERERDKGLGLGLTIAKRMAALLGHPIAVQSKIGEGSTFSITVPLAESPKDAR